MHACIAIAQEPLQQARQTEGGRRIAKRRRFAENINSARLRWFDLRKNHRARRAGDGWREEAPAKLLVVADNSLPIEPVEQEETSRITVTAQAKREFQQPQSSQRNQQSHQPKAPTTTG